MKILAINLLRLGDFIQLVPVLNALAARHVGASIDVLSFRQSRGLRPLLPLVGNWWTLDRDELQSGLARADIPLLTSFDVLREQLEDINARRYDLIVNLTQTRFAALIAGYLESADKFGVSIDRRGQALFHSPWLRYLEEHARAAGPDIFNYTDIFMQASGLGGVTRVWPLSPTAGGVAEARALELRGRPVIVCQVRTSDVKKNWGETAWRAFLPAMREAVPGCELVLLGAPDEREAIERLAQESGARAAVLSLDGALALLKTADLLVTGDTSIKHLANAVALPVLELSLGSSDLRQTGVYKEDSLIIQAGSACAPCPHSGPCGQPTHACAESIEPQVVARAAGHLLRGEWDALKARGSAKIEFFRTRHLATGFWFAENLAGDPAHREFDTLLERCTWQFLLNQEFREPLSAFGSETVRLETEVARLWPHAPPQALLAHLDFLEDREESRRQESGVSTLARELAGRPVDLAVARARQNRLTDSARQLEIKIKLIRSLKSRLMEKT